MCTYQVSIKEKPELEFITTTRIGVPALAQEEDCSPADDQLPICTQTAPPVAVLSPLPALPVFHKQMWTSAALAMSGVEAQGGRNHGSYVLLSLTECVKPRSVH